MFLRHFCSQTNWPRLQSGLGITVGHWSFSEQKAENERVKSSFARQYNVYTVAYQTL